MNNTKPLAVTALIAALGILLVYLDSPTMDGISEYRFAFLVPVFTSVIAVFSLYFIYKKLCEVME